MANLNDPLGALAEMDTAAGKVSWFSLAKLEEQGAGAVSRLPYSIKVLLEAALRQSSIARGATSLICSRVISSNNTVIVFS